MKSTRDPARLEDRRWPRRLARQEARRSGGRFLASELVRQDRTERQQPLRCARCGYVITHRDEAISVAGGHEHTFVNPAGLIFIVRLFRHTPGCRFLGRPSRAFSWFPGYLWRLALCEGCGGHLGWLFQKTTDEFTALIAAALREKE